MSTAILFFLSSLFTLFFIIIRIFSQTSWTQKQSNLTTTSSSTSQSGKLLLLIGPVLIGLGVITWFGSEWSTINTLLKVYITGIVTLVSLLAGFIAVATSPKTDAKKKPAYIIGESFMYLGSLLFGGFLFILNVYLVEKGHNSLGVSEILGVWFIALLGTAFYLKSVWGMVLSACIHFLWTATFLSTQFTIYEFAGINSNAKLEVWGDVQLYFLISVLGVIASGAVAYLIRNSYKEINTVTSRAMQYISSWMHYSLVGALIIRSIREDSGDLTDGANAYITAMIITVVTGVLLVIDQYAKKYIKNYTIHNLSLFSVIVAGIAGFIASQTTIVTELMNINQPTPFFGFLFLEVAFVGWMLSSYLRDNDELAMILFFGFNFIQIFILTFDPSALAIFKLITILTIIMYAALLHSYRKGLVGYVTVMGIISLMIQTINKGASIYVVLIVIGVILMGFGVFFTQAQTLTNKNRSTDE